MSAPQLHFNAFIWPNGYHEAAWRVVDDDVRNVLGLAYYTDIARTAERGLMDSIFLADNTATAEYRVTHLPQTQFDPISVLSALAAVTSHIGLIGTGSTTYSSPWELARRVATLEPRPPRPAPGRVQLRRPRPSRARRPVRPRARVRRRRHPGVGQLGGRCR